MRAPFWLVLAWRESRSSARRLGVYMAAITVGVAALVAINSFRSQVVESVDAEGKTLLGADVRVRANRPFPDSITSVLDSAAAAGVPVSYVTTTLSVALTGIGASRLAQVRAVDDGGYPFYGDMATMPAGEWPMSGAGRSALAEEALLQQLGAATGDSVRLGNAWFTIAGVLTDLPPELGFRNAIGPRIFIHADALPATGLVQFGSLVQYEAYLRIPTDDAAQRFVDLNHDTFRRSGIGFDTSSEQAEELAEALDALGRFLGLVGLSALLLGGLGVASAVHLFVKEKRRTVAVLRCLGARQRTAFGAYLFQAVALGTIGAGIGAVLGVAAQALLPAVLGDLLPIEVAFSIEWDVVGAGIAIGAIVAGAFALLPLLAVRGISPMRALRYDTDEATSRFDGWRIAAFLLIVACVAVVSVWQARVWEAGLAYAGGLAAGMLVLWACAHLLMALTRRLARGRLAAMRGRSVRVRGLTFALRTGLANLHRPRNQTAAVTIALGFGVFLVATLWIVQQNLLAWMQPEGSSAADLVLFDIQPDQIAEVRELIGAHAATAADMVPMVPARISAINGVTVDSLLSESPRRVENWAVRREYRHTYRDSLTSTEELVLGRGFREADPAPAGVVRVSVEEEVAQNLDVGPGDRITWDVSGIAVESIITSVRAVDWARFETNFFFVFEPGALESAPQSIVSLVALSQDSARATLQRETVQRFPNVSVIDIAAVQRILRRITDRIIFAIRFMAGFSAAAGSLVLVGAIAASRFQRVRESALLRALGASRQQVRNIMLVEYAAIGALAAFIGITLAVVAGWLLVKFSFDLGYSLPIAPLAALWAGVTAAAALIGMLNSREALRSTPLGALREAET